MAKRKSSYGPLTRRVLNLDRGDFTAYATGVKQADRALSKKGKKKS